eukprot:CAMPEP_0201903066 /NCGR_PEP_ID=MMETSP0902-20130614/55285_1 /ASSEMBLY_ACC=CAM_ASM_000551 /TAXON_ID=420261 /ORGANISM="Thalassiosira antarctica, Strain CCMP982" /LENGTH=58 /DNA_ID=CAMNT_0048437099 /DNA_START=1061 /DNA_END=1234 /DNA_ORIENTATION=-
MKMPCFCRVRASLPSTCQTTDNARHNDGNDKATLNAHNANQAHQHCDAAAEFPSERII